MPLPLSRCLLSGLIAVAALALPTLPARAALVNYTFTGTITTLNDPTSILGGQVRIGDSYSGTLVYDSSTSGVNLTPTRAIYNYQPDFTKNFVRPIGITARVGGFSISPDYFYGNMYAQVFNNAASNLGGVADGFIVAQDYGGPAGQFETAVELYDATAAIFSSLALPTSLVTSNFNLGSFSYSQFQYNGIGGVAVPLFSGTINGLASSSAVPEPMSVSLLGVGLLVTGFRHRGGRRRGVRAD